MRQRQVVDELGELNAQLNLILSDVVESEAWKTGSVSLTAVGLLEPEPDVGTSQALETSHWDPPLVAAYAELARNGSPRDRARVASAVCRVSFQGEEKTAAFVSAGGIDVLLALIAVGSATEKQRAAGALRDVAWRHDISDVITKTDGIKSVLELARNGTHSQQVEAVAALWNIAHKNHASCRKIADAGGVDVLIAILTSATGKRKQSAIGALSALSREPNCRSSIGKTGAIKVLIDVARTGEKGQQNQAAGALWTLSFENPDNRGKIVAEGGVEALVALLMNGNKEQRSNAMGALRNLSRTPGVASRIREAGGIVAIIRAIRKGPKLQEERGAAVLCNIAMSDKDIRTAIVEAGGMELFLKLVREGQGELVDSAMGMLNSLAAEPSSEPAFATSDAINTILGVVDKGSDSQKSRATCTCWRISYFHPETKALIHDAGGVKALIALAREGNEIKKDLAVGTLANLTLDQSAAESIRRDGGVDVLVECERNGSGSQRHTLFIYTANNYYT